MDLPLDPTLAYVGVTKKICDTIKEHNMGIRRMKGREHGPIKEIKKYITIGLNGTNVILLLV